MVPPSATVLYAMRGRQDVVAASSRKHVQGPGPTREDRRLRQPGPRYKWVALTNTTMGVLMVVINGSITIIALPAIFRGIRLNPLAPGNSSYFLWVLMGFLLITSVLVLTFGRLGDMYGRVRMYNLGFAIFTVFSILLSINWMTGTAGALWIILMRAGQAIGGSLEFANSSAILTDAFPEDQRGLALGINSVAAITGSFIGLVLGGVLAPVDWRLVFLISVPFGVFGTAWAYLKLVDNGVRVPARIDWLGNITFALGPDGSPDRRRVRDTAIRRTPHGLDESVRAGHGGRRVAPCWRRSAGSRPGSPIRCSGCTCSRSGPLPPATSPDSWAHSPAADFSSC